MRIPGRLYVTMHRVQNSWQDLFASLAGYCNNCPWTPDPGKSNGYTFWRCALKDGHDGLHRNRNYVWADDGKCSYDPLESFQIQQPKERKVTPSRRQSRQRDKWDKENGWDKRSYIRKRRIKRAGQIFAQGAILLIAACVGVALAGLVVSLLIEWAA